MSERYEILGRLGQGGSGSVYRAFDKQLQRQVAVKKLIAPGGDGGSGATTHGGPETLLHEALALSALQHPNIVTVHDIGMDETGPWVVMELLEGSTLDDAVKDAPLPLKEFTQLVNDSLSALAAAHAGNILHRDLKPSNIMLVWLPTGELRFKLLDFGIAKFAAAPSLQTLDVGGTVLGSIHYMAPEQFERAPLDARTDLYSLGCTFFFALTTRHPFTGDSAAQVMAGHLQHRVPPLAEWRPDLPASVVQWVLRLMARSPADRPDTAVQALALFRHALQPAAQPRPGPRPAPVAARPAAAASAPPPPKGFPWLAVGSSAAALAVIAAVLVAFRSQKPAPPTAAPAPTSVPAVTSAPAAVPVAVSSSQTVPPPHDLEHFRSMLDQEAEVEGVVSSIGESKTGRTRYVNFSRRPGETISLALRTAEMESVFPMSRLESLTGRRIRARGRVGEFNGSLLLYVERGQDITDVR